MSSLFSTSRYAISLPYLSYFQMSTLEQVINFKPNHNHVLQDLRGLSRIDKLDSLVILENAQVTSVDFLEVPRMRFFEIKGNTSLTPSDFGSLNEADYLTITSNRQRPGTMARSLAAVVDVHDRENVAGNMGDRVSTVPNFCPWIGDGGCDERTDDDMRLCTPGTDTCDCWSADEDCLTPHPQAQQPNVG